MVREFSALDLVTIAHRRAGLDPTETHSLRMQASNALSAAAGAAEAAPSTHANILKGRGFPCVCCPILLSKVGPTADVVNTRCIQPSTTRRFRRKCRTSVARHFSPKSGILHSRLGCRAAKPVGAGFLPALDRSRGSVGGAASLFSAEMPPSRSKKPGGGVRVTPGRGNRDASPPNRCHGIFQARASAWVISATRSSGCSTPIDSLIVDSRTPIRSRTSLGTPEWVMAAGWLASDSVPPRLTASFNI